MQAVPKIEGRGRTANTCRRWIETVICRWSLRITRGEEELGPGLGQHKQWPPLLSAT